MKEAKETKKLFLNALDAEDMVILSAQLQDAIFKTGDMIYLKKAKRFAATCNRFCWEDTLEESGEKPYRRTLCGLHWDSVLEVKSQGIDLEEKESLLTFLAMRFEASDSLGGFVEVMFAGGGRLRLRVEALDVYLQDLEESWETKHCPQHDRAVGAPGFRLEAGARTFEEAFDVFLRGRENLTAPHNEEVRKILEDVRHLGDSALLEATERFDAVKLTPSALRVGREALREASRGVAEETRAALVEAASRIEAFHKRQKPQDTAFEDEEGVAMGLRWLPLASVGLYCPGGTASYPSSLLMNAIPAKIAGVKRIALASPPPISPLILAAAEIAGVEEIYQMGGAQALGALAYGTESIKPVDKIFGPGNAYVAEAKRQLFGHVGIDMVAGPSEILVLADESADAHWAALDLLSQAEHDRDAQSILMTSSAEFAEKTCLCVEMELRGLPREEIARASWENHGAVILLEKMEDAPPLIDRIAPEHLEIMTAAPEKMAKRIKNAGAVFLGGHTPEAIGDYSGGTNHVLPTNRTARFASGLSVYDFMKRTSWLHVPDNAFGKVGETAVRLARAEGLEAHARAVESRTPAMKGGTGKRK